jgi:hypothetical protein
MKNGLLFLFITGIMVSCEFAKEYSFAPSTIKIQSVSMRNTGNQYISHHIRDLWVYIDDQYVGSFSVPFSFPVLETGEKRIKLYPGIRYYGILSKPEIYTLIAPVEIVQKLIPNNTLELQPDFFYKDGISVFIDEGFESGSVFLNDLDSLPASKLVRSTLLSREGNYAGYAALDKQNSIVETASTFFTLADSKSAFLEFDFKSDTDINVGIISFPSKSKNYFLTLRPATEWKKVYIPLFEVLAENSKQSFQLAFRGILTDKMTAGYYAIDNVKVLSLQ